MLILRINNDDDIYRTGKLFISRPQSITKFLPKIKSKMKTGTGKFANEIMLTIIDIICFQGKDLNEEYNELYVNEVASFKEFLYKIKLLDLSMIEDLITHSQKNHIYQVDISKVASYNEEVIFSASSSLVEKLNKGLEKIK